MTTEQRFTVFYSWQSNSPADTNWRLIREGLREAASLLETENAGTALHVVIDEATRDVPGSPNIPQTVLSKIRQADAFVGDITTINVERPPGSRACPNPNVAIELGYAIGNLGWGRVVLVFNEAYGKFPDDAPFDIDRHRLSNYSVSSASMNDTTGTRKEKHTRLTELKKPLFELLYDALKLVIAARPPKPADADELSPAERKHRRDVETLREVLATVHVPTLDEFFDEIQSGTISRRVFHFWETFNARVGNNNLFHLYDPTLRSLVREFHKAWAASLGFGEYFLPHPSGKYYSFRAPGDVFDEPQRKAWKRMQKSANVAKQKFGAILEEVRERYLEIDVKKTNHEAWGDYTEFRTEMKRVFGDGSR